MAFQEGSIPVKTIVLTAAAVLGFAASGLAATMTGVISDSMCGASHAAMTEHGKKMSDKQCTTACIQHGAKYVFVEGNKVMAIANQDFKGLADVAGDTVKLTGDVKGDTITVTKIEKAK
jgi:hypothetical protein